MRNLKTHSSIFLLLLCSFTLAYASPAKLHLISSNSKARCLDGTSPGFYFSLGQGNDASNFLIFFQGGGRCSGNTVDGILKDCLSRSKTQLGSSKKWSSTYSNTGNFSENKAENPLFYSWSKVYVNYCDGALFQGSSEPITVNKVIIYFRGYDNVKGIFDSLANEYGLLNAKTVVLGGGSAGALGSFFWSQYLRKFLPEKILLISSPDSGFFPTLEDTKTGVEQVKFYDLITNKNREILQPQGCQYLHDNDNLFKCQSLVNVVDLIPVPTFIINSLYDEYSLSNILQVACLSSTHSLSNCSLKDQVKINWLHKESFNQLKLIQKKKPSWGIWAISCVLHVFSTSKLSFSGDSYSVSKGVRQSSAQSQKQFIDGLIAGKLSSNNFYIDSVDYPGNDPCK